MSYNGWSNYETWNASLWLSNDEGSYRELQSLVHRAYDAENLAEKIEELCRAIWENGKTPDGANLDAVDFEEIAQGEWSEYHGDDETKEAKPETGALADFIKDNNLSFECHRVAKRGDGLMSDLPRHFHCRIKSANRQFSLYFSQGAAHTDEPTLSDVLDCLASDASGFENAGSFEEWASDLGFDTDSRVAEKMYRVTKRQAAQLKRVLGEADYNQLLWHTERQ